MYEVKVYPERNHLFVKVGSLEPHEPEDLVREVMGAVGRLRPGWSVITDLSEALSPDPSHGDLLGPAMKRLAAAGMGKAIRVVGNARVMPRLWEKTSAAEGGYSAEVVATLAEAEARLADWTRRR